MSREAFSSGQAINTGTRSPGRPSRRLTELPTVDRSPSRDYGARGSPLGDARFLLKVKHTLSRIFKFAI